MILEFPTGSESQNSGDIVGNIAFYREGTWSFIPKITDISDPDFEKALEAVDFFTFCISRQDFIDHFWEHKKSKNNELFDEWRKDNIRLVKNDYDSED